MGAGDRGLIFPSPVAPAALFFGLGIFFAAWLPPFPRWFTLCASWLLLLLVLLLARAGRAAGTVAGCALFLSLGMARLQGSDISRSEGHPPGGLSGEVTLTGEVSAPAEVKGELIAIEMDEVVISMGEEPFRPPGRVLAYIDRDSPSWPVGSRLTMRGRISPVRGERNLSWFPWPVDPGRRRLSATVYVSSPVWVRREEGKRGGALAALAGMREGAVSFWRSFDSPSAPLLQALTTGMRSEIPEPMRRCFARSGLAHLLAVSGLHLGIIAFLLYTISLRSLSRVQCITNRWPAHYWAAALTIPLLGIFYLFLGAQVSAGRAAFMAGLGLGAAVFLRSPDVLNLLSLAALLMLTADPWLLFSISFQLSFSAVAALITAAPFLRTPLRSESGMVRRGAGYFRSLAAVSLVAGAGTLPLTAYHFQSVSLAGPLANLAAIPLTCFLVMPLGWGALVVNGIWPGGGEILGRAALAAGSILTGTARFFSTIPFASFSLSRPSPLVTALLLVTIFILLSPRRSLRRLLIASMVLIALYGAGMPTLRGGSLEGIFIDVGQGEAVFLRLPDGRSLLVDTGPSWKSGDAGRKVVAPALRKMGVRRIDYLVLTHLHPDHSGGLESLLLEFPVGEIWSGSSGREKWPQRMKAILNRWESRGGVLSHFSRGDRWGKGELEIVFLNPPSSPYRDRSGKEDLDLNDNSLAFTVRWRDVRLLLTGDAGDRAVGDMLEMLSQDEEIALVKVPHHGGRQVSSIEMASRLRPRYAVISVGRNGYGHPDPSVTEAFDKAGEVLRTDKDGGIFIKSDGEGIEVKNWRRLAESRTLGERVRWLITGY